MTALMARFALGLGTARGPALFNDVTRIRIRVA